MLIKMVRSDLIEKLEDIGTERERERERERKREWERESDR